MFGSSTGGGEGRKGRIVSEKRDVQVLGGLFELLLAEMRVLLSRWTWAYLGMVCFSLAGYGATHALKLNPVFIAPFSAFLTLALGAAAILEAMLKAAGAGIWRGFWQVLLLGVAVEVVGVITGFPFGRYAYSQRWAPVVHLPGVGWFPLLVPLAWFLIVGAAAASVTRFGRGERPPWVYAAWAALAAATVDLVMEPVMVYRLGYWEWLDKGPLPGAAPLTNFAGWFAASFVAAWWLYKAGARAANISWDPPIVLAGHVAMTIGLGLLS